MSDENRYFIAPAHSGDSFWTEVRQADFVKSERAENFFPKPGLGPVATAGFSGMSVKGRVIFGEEHLKRLGAYMDLEGKLHQPNWPAGFAPEEPKEAPLPSVKRLRPVADSPVRLMLPKGSYAAFDDADGMLVLQFSPEQYTALAKAQGPVAVEGLAFRVANRAVPEDSFREDLRDMAVDVLKNVASDMRTGKRTENPVKVVTSKIRAVKDLLK